MQEFLRTAGAFSRIAKKIFRSPYALLFLMIAPGFFWAFVDNSVWPWDQAWYGEMSVNLYYTLTHSFSDWYPAVMKAFATKSPGIAWFGQFFVPLGFLVGIEKALLFFILLAQFFTLIITYKIIFSLTRSKKISLTACLAMTGAPLFVGMGHQYFVEPFQLLAVVFFVYIATKSEVWSKYDQIIALVAASAFAMIIKISSPMYVFLPALVILRNIFVSPKSSAKRYFFDTKSRILIYAAGISFLAVSVNWYTVNSGHILKFMKETSSGSVALFFGKEMPFFEKLPYWLNAFQKSFFIPGVFEIVILIIAISAAVLFSKRTKFTRKEINYSALISFFSVAVVLTIFSFQVNEETRYLLPILIYLAIILSWVLYYIKNDLINYSVLVVFLSQFIFVNGYTLNLINVKSPNFSVWAIPVHADISEKTQAKFAVSETCGPETKGKINMVGVEYPWLNANSLAFYAGQNQLSTGMYCYYTSLGFAEKDVEKAWARMTETIKPPYFIGVPPGSSKEKIPDAFNAVSREIFEKVEKSDLFTKQNIPELSGIQIFKSNFLSNEH